MLRCTIECYTRSRPLWVFVSATPPWDCWLSQPAAFTLVLRTIDMNQRIKLAAAGILLSLGLSGAHASVLDTATTHVAAQAQLYGVFHDRATDFVFVKLPQGWTFAGQDARKSTHEVFYDVSTGFVFVKLSSGWRFLGRSNA